MNIKFIASCSRFPPTLRKTIDVYVCCLSLFERATCSTLQVGRRAVGATHCAGAALQSPGFGSATKQETASKLIWFKLSKHLQTFIEHFSINFSKISKGNEFCNMTQISKTGHRLFKSYLSPAKPLVVALPAGSRSRTKQFRSQI